MKDHNLNDCDHFAELISAQLDEALTPGERAELEEHLAQCPSCRALQKDFQELHQILLEAAAHWRAEPPEDLTQRVLDKVHAAKVTPLPTRNNRWRQWASIAAVLALVVIGGSAVTLGQFGGAAPPGQSRSIMPPTENTGNDGPLADEVYLPESGEDNCAGVDAASLPESQSIPAPNPGALGSDRDSEEQSGFFNSTTNGNAEGDSPSDYNSLLPSVTGKQAGGETEYAPTDGEVLSTPYGDGTGFLEDPNNVAGTSDGTAPAMYCLVDMTPVLLVNGERFYWTESSTPSSEAVEVLADGTYRYGTELPQGYTLLGEISSVSEDSPQNELQLQASFPASGTVYVNAAEPDSIYVNISTDWLTDSYVRFDSASAAVTAPEDPVPVESP